MPVTKCKHCCQVITQDAIGLWLDSGVIFQSLCLTSPDHIHEPEEEEKQPTILQFMDNDAAGYYHLMGILKSNNQEKPDAT